MLVNGIISILTKFVKIISKNYRITTDCAPSRAGNFLLCAAERRKNRPAQQSRGQSVEKVRVELGFFDRLKQSKDTLLGLLFHKLRSCGIAARKAGARRAMNSEGCGLCSSGHLVIVRSVRLSVFQIRSTAKQMLCFISRLPV